MSAQISGVQVSWGIPSAAKTAANTLAAGIVEDFKPAAGGNTTEIVDEDGDHVTRVDHGEKNTVNITVKILDAETLPVKGTEVTFAADVGGLGLNSGRCFIDSAELLYKGNDASTASFTVSHYPEMAADA